MTIPRLHCVDDLSQALTAISQWDAVVMVTSSLAAIDLDELKKPIHQAKAVDRKLEEGTHFIAAPEVAGGRLIVAHTGPFNRDSDDVRAFADAAERGIIRAREAGAKAPLLLARGIPAGLAFAHAHELTVLGALAGLWEPLEARKDLGEKEAEPITQLACESPADGQLEGFTQTINALEIGRRLARDIAGTQPEWMTPLAIADLCAEAFAHSRIQVKVERDSEHLHRDYPLLSAVARASFAVPRHHPCVVKLVYEGDGPITRTWLLAGKGVTYDTGGSDLKVGGHMAGMSRDKGGCAAVAGFMKTLELLEPAGVRVVAELGCVRNSIGSDAYVSDEIIRSHAGVRVRIGNTDAEGRLVLADLLSHLREQTVEAPSAHLFSIATLTGHAARAVGPYSIAIDNGAARVLGTARLLEQLGDLWGDPFEVSRLRREDWSFIDPRSRADDLINCNNAPSTATNRGHQFPMAFLARASGLDRHGRHDDLSIPFTHIDIGGSAYRDCDWQHGRPTATPISALLALLRHQCTTTSLPPERDRLV